MKMESRQRVSNLVNLDGSLSIFRFIFVVTLALSLYILSRFGSTEMESPKKILATK